MPMLVKVRQEENYGLRWDTGSSGGEGSPETGRVEVICFVVIHFSGVEEAVWEARKGEGSRKEKGRTLGNEGDFGRKRRKKRVSWTHLFIG